MQLDRYTDRLRQQVAAVADAGSVESRELAERIGVALEPALRLVLLELLAEAAGEVSRELAPGGVDVRLRGADPELVVSRPVAAAAEEGAPPPAAAGPVADEDSASFRTTLRLPERLKARVEQAAGADGVSVNTWLVRAVSAALEGERPRAAPQTGNRFTGWAR